MEITAKAVKELREMSGCGMMDCKKALKECDGDMDKAFDYLREQGLNKAAKKASRIAAEGIVESYIHMGGKIGVLVEINCETDFVAKTDAFKALAHDIAMHIAAAKPTYVRRDEVDTSELDHEREVLRAQALAEPKPKPLPIIEKMVEGRIEKYYKEVCLMEQPFVKDPDMNVEKMLAAKAPGTKIIAFTRYKMGDGLEKKVNDLAAEVAEQIGK